MTSRLLIIDGTRSYLFFCRMWLRRSYTLSLKVTRAFHLSVCIDEWREDALLFLIFVALATVDNKYSLARRLLVIRSSDPLYTPSWRQRGEYHHQLLLMMMRPIHPQSVSRVDHHIFIHPKDRPDHESSLFCSTLGWCFCYHLIHPFIRCFIRKVYLSISDN